MRVNEIYNENCIDTMLRMPNEFIQSIITSPPYFNLRDYGVKNQIGIEKTYNEYLKNLIDIFIECKRVLKKDGICFVNLGDTYLDNSLIGIPDRFKILMIDNGWICRNDIIWHKPNAIPQSVKNRFSNDYERVLMFSKSKQYKFNTQYEERKTKVSNKGNKKQESKYLSDEQEKEVRQGMNKKRGLKLLEKRNNLPEHLFFVNFLRSRTNAKDLFENTNNIKLSTIEHWFRKDEAGFSYPKLEDWNNVKDFIDDWSDEFHLIDCALTNVEYEYDDINKNAHLGRLKRSVWSINTKPSKEKHFATYPEELISTPILCSTDENDLIYDPFMGSGTTALVSKKNNRNYIGSEISKEYCEIANKRLR
jgi:DNA modification methylase